MLVARNVHDFVDAVTAIIILKWKKRIHQLQP
jgi:hypothetical protein